MPNVTYDDLHSVLSTLSATSDDIQACAVVSIDGLLLASNFPAGLDEERVGALAAALVALGDRTGKELERGEMQEVFVRCSEGMVALTSAGSERVLIALCLKSAKPGVISLDMQGAAEEIGKIV